MSFYTIKTPTLLFPCFLKKLGSRRKWIQKNIFDSKFDKVSDFQSRKLLRIKVWIKFCKKRQILIKQFTTHQILKAICYFYKSEFEENFASGKLTLGALYNVKTPKLPFLCVLHKYEYEKNKCNEKQFLSKSFNCEWNFQLIFFSVRQFLNWDFLNVSDSKTTI